jgi:hypothetical protein
MLLHIRVTIDRIIYCSFKKTRRKDFESFNHEEMINVGGGSLT